MVPTIVKPAVFRVLNEGPPASPHTVYWTPIIIPLGFVEVVEVAYDMATVWVATITNNVTAMQKRILLSIAIIGAYGDQIRDEELVLPEQV
jgi:hypothetical protein